ncbi:MAG: hypothetical protein R2762_27745 [Bryobacteraceae bacterium]
MPFTLFNPEGKPLRASVAAETWLMECSFESGRSTPPSALVGHEIAHTVQRGVTVRGWCAASRKPLTSGFSHTRTPASSPLFLPEVGDEVLVAFESASPRANAVIFNPNEFNISKSVAWGRSGAAVLKGVYRIIVRRRGVRPLSLVLITAADPGPGLADVFRIA